MNRMTKPALALAVAVGLAGPVGANGCPAESLQAIQAAREHYVFVIAELAAEASMEGFRHRALFSKCMQNDGTAPMCAAAALAHRQNPDDAHRARHRELEAAIEDYGAAVAGAVAAGCQPGALYPGR